MDAEKESTATNICSTEIPSRIKFQRVTFIKSVEVSITGGVTSLPYVETSVT